MKRVYIVTLVTALLLVGVFTGVVKYLYTPVSEQVLKVGFVYEGDESSSDVYDFYLAQRLMQQELGPEVEVYTRSNLPENETGEPLRDMIRKGCKLIFAFTESGQVRSVAAEFPSVQICQLSCPGAMAGRSIGNFHSFNAEMYQGRYITGLAAGLKLREMIDSGELAPEDALVGFVGTTPASEVISGYTAFLLGVRSMAPEATLRVRYTGVRSSFSKEKSCAQALIKSGCVVVSERTYTNGTALAVEEANASGRRVFLAGYGQNMLDVAPSSSLISIRTNWSPYVEGAVQALREGRAIEQIVSGNAHGRDLSAGFAQDWIQVLEINHRNAARGTGERISQAIEGLKKGTLQVFKGDYVGVDPKDESDTVDLSKGYAENADRSLPSFHYVLKDVVRIDY